MVPDHDPAADDAPEVNRGPAIDRGELYVIINKAVEDAILGALGTLLLVGVSFVLIWYGMLATISSYESSILGALGGVIVTLVGLYFAGSSLNLIPSVTDIW